MKRRKRRETRLRIDSTSEAILLNRYLAFVRCRKFNRRGTLKQNVPVKEWTYYHVQWLNIKADILGFIKNPLAVSPRIAWSLLAFLFIVLGDHIRAHHTAFMMGSLAYDAAAQSSASGEPSTISWNHTVSGTNRLLITGISGLSGGLSTTYNGVSMTDVASILDPTEAAYLIAPATGTNSVVQSGGNIKVGASVSFTGADQTTPIGATTSNDGGASPAAISLTTTAANSMRVDVHGAGRDDVTTTTASLSAGTSRANPTTPQNQFRESVFIYTDPVASAGSTSRTWTTDAFNRQYLAFEVKEAASTAAIPNKIVQMRQAVKRSNSF